MNRINICKNIIQSIRDYITNPDNLDAYREKNRFTKIEIRNATPLIESCIYSYASSIYSFIHLKQTIITSCMFAWRQQRRYSCQILYQATRNTLLSTIVCTSSMLLMRAAHSGILPSTYARTLPRFPEKSGSIVLSTHGTKVASTIHITFASIASNAERPTCAKSF